MFLLRAVFCLRVQPKCRVNSVHWLGVEVLEGRACTNKTWEASHVAYHGLPVPTAQQTLSHRRLGFEMRSMVVGGYSMAVLGVVSFAVPSFCINSGPH